MAVARTLIEDDHVDVRFLIRAIVGRFRPPIEIVGEADGAEAALAQLAALEPDVVVLDAEVLFKAQFDEIPTAIVRLASAGRDGDEPGDQHG
jgi:DNA-binding NarL/FixJ family response regulator